MLCCLWFDVSRALCGVYCLAFVVCRVLRVRCVALVFVLMSVVFSWFCVARCLVYVACNVLHIVCSWLYDR